MKEKSEIEKKATKHQSELLSLALGDATKANGQWLNADGKQYPKLYPKGVSVNPFNALILALHSDRNHSKTNLFIPFSEAKTLNAPIREHERGVPFLFYNWNKYVNKQNPEETISRKDYLALQPEEQQQYKGLRNREVRTLFNLDQTIMRFTDEKQYDKAAKNHGGLGGEPMTKAQEQGLRIRFNDFLLHMQDNLVPIRVDATGMAHYDTKKDVVFVARQKDFATYQDYAQEALRQIVSATGHQQRLAREGMVMNGGRAPSEDAIKHERLVVDLASGVKMLELGLPARLSEATMKDVPYWQRELKENPCLVDALESDVNNALDVIRKAERGEKIAYASEKNQALTNELNDQLPKHYLVADEISRHPDKDDKTMVLVIDTASKSADVVLPSGASLEVNNEIPGMSKSRIERALNKEGIEHVRFFNPDGALGYRPDDSYFAAKEISVAKLKNWSFEKLSSLDATEAVERANKVGFERIQMVMDDNNRWALFVKPEGKPSFAVIPDKEDTNRFFSTLKQANASIDDLRVELAEKYYAKTQNYPELKIDLFGEHSSEIDMNRIKKVNLFKSKSDVILCAVTIEGAADVQPRVVSPNQWQRMWLADDRETYKKQLAAKLFADVLIQTKDVKNVEELKEEVKELPKSVPKEWYELKQRHPDALLLMRHNGFYQMYNEDVEKGQKILGVSLEKLEGGNLSAGFPYHCLDTYLPKLIRSGQRVAICDQLDEPRKQQQEQQQSENESKGMKR